MKYLPFERTYQLEWSQCPKCAGSGVAPIPSRHASRDCWNCRGLGRKITRSGRELFYEICEMLGAPVRERASRIAPRHLAAIAARNIRPGMRVADTHPDRHRPLQEVTDVQPARREQLRFTFADGSIVNVLGYDLFSRELTDQELDRVDAVMALHLGRGAIKAEESRTQAIPQG